MYSYLIYICIYCFMSWCAKHYFSIFFFFFFKQKTAYEMLRSLVGSEMCIRDSSKSAFVITIVKNTSFCTSAFQAIVILFENIVRVGTLTTLSTISCFLIKMFIVGCNMIIGYGLMQVTTVNDGEEVESGLFPLIGILFATFIIASLFVSVFEACVDTIMICFFIDEKDFEGRFLPPNLAKLVDKFSHIEKARKEYESQLATTTSHGEEPTKQ
eukprot:TRINITY_DN7283_c0_g1_i6.p1 TRINITY_DN7283_c0_g1~~TRINITY_DN7283_c0_g1_i6.p1  ORF type:complete len:213 (+),score=84.72 TRINITY_DN7283_c0_g1_i6:46-684(+)